jgi:CHAD domain-containing protein
VPALHQAEIARLDQLIAALVLPEDIDDSVHATRKGVKRLRAHLRLIRDGIDKDLYRNEDADLRQIGLLLAQARDAFVLTQTLESLESSAGWDSAAAFITAHHQAAVGELLTGPIEEVRRMLVRARRRWPDPGSLTAGAIAAGVARTYSSGREEIETAAATGHAAAFHAWRKRVKYLRYQLSSLTELGDCLGLEHDHTVFIQFCDDNIDMLPDRRDRYVLIDRAERRRDELRSLALATDVYDRQTDVFIEAVVGE